MNRGRVEFVGYALVVVGLAAVFAAPFLSAGEVPCGCADKHVDVEQLVADVVDQPAEAV